MDRHLVAPIPRLAAGIAPESWPVLGENGGYSIDAAPASYAAPHASPIVEAIHTPFSTEGFSIPRVPLVVGRAALHALPEEIGISDMVIKWPGIGYRVPSELAGLRGFLERCAAVEASINPQADEYYAYLTVQRTLVQAGQRKRGEGAHSDSIQGPRIQPKVAIEHGYTTADRDPTRFFTHGFDLTRLNPDTHWLNAAFAAQADRGRSIRFCPGDVVLFDAYTIHEAVPAEVTARRSFVRLIFSVREFDRLGNTVNRLFDYDWDFQPRPVPQGLIGLPDATS